jgi:hypothetical protein
MRMRIATVLALGIGLLILFGAVIFALLQSGG